MPPIDISLIPTNDLLISLFARFDHAVFHGIVARPDQPGDVTKLYSLRTTGYTHTEIGLANSIGYFVNKKLDEQITELDSSEL